MSTTLDTRPNTRVLIVEDHTLFAESLEADPKVIIAISHASGRAVRWIEGPTKAGLHRVSWDLRGPNPEPVELDPPGFRPP